MQSKSNDGIMPNRDTMPVVLWLASWYPCKLDAFNGDFIQRAALSLSFRIPVHVFYLMKDEKGIFTNHVLEETTQTGNLTETRVYYKPFQTGIKKIDQIISAWQYLNLGKKWLKRFRNKQAKGKPWIVEVGVAMRAGMLALWMKRKWGQPYIVQEHWTGYYRYLMPPDLQRGAVFWKMNVRILKHADRLLPDSRHLGEWINEDLIPIPFTEIPNAVDTRIFRYDGSIKTDGIFRFIHVSTLGYQKNTDGILRAFQQLVMTQPTSGIELEIVGPGYEHHLDYVRKNESLQGKVRFIGPVPYLQVANHMRSAHAFVLFSRFENLPCVMLEAFCCGLPVIATRVGGIAYHLPASHGILVESENEIQLLEAMKNVYHNYSSFNRDLIAETASSVYSMESIGMKYEKIYSEIYPHLFAKNA